MTEKFNLQWNDFQSNVTSAFSQFRNRSNFQDVTLVSDDKKQISAHRVVLSVSSAYFNTLLSQNSHSHPLLCLDGINSFELNNILDFIYTGELQIYQEDVDRFIQIAQRLQLHGLLQSDEHKNKEKIEAEAATNETEITEFSESDSNNLTAMTHKHKIISMNSEDFQNIEELDSYIDQQIIKINEGYKCNICNKVSKYRGHSKEHMEVHINGLSFDCSFCGKTMSSRSSLRFHKSNRCKNRKL